jgi:hypothetical protein
MVTPLFQNCWTVNTIPFSNQFSLFIHFLFLYGLADAGGGGCCSSAAADGSSWGCFSTAPSSAGGGGAFA